MSDQSQHKCLYNKLKELYDSDVEITISGNYRLGDIRHNYADLSKVKSIALSQKFLLMMV